MSTRGDRLLTLAKDIVRMEERLAVLRSEFDLLVGGDSAEGDMGAPIARIDHRRGTYEARMLVIFAEADRPLNATDVVVALGEGASEDVVRAFFSKLLRKGLIARVAHGLYCKRGLSAKAGTS